MTVTITNTPTDSLRPFLPPFQAQTKVKRYEPTRSNSTDLSASAAANHGEFRHTLSLEAASPAREPQDCPPATHLRNLPP